MKSRKSVIVVHGGAGDWPRQLHKSALAGVRRAADDGFRVLQRGGSALDAVETAVVSMEDNRLFNAGTGSCLNLLGEIETDAAIMDGQTLRGGGVALLRGIRNPVKAARAVMDKTNHVLLGGDAARRFALESGGVEADLRVPRRIRAWRDQLRKLKRTGKASSIIMSTTVRNLLKERLDTVGALALDDRGNLAAADSTGGVTLKLPGRIGDSPILGAGLYADNRAGAATATGLGEQAMRLVISKAACDLMKLNTAPVAAEKAVRHATKKLGVGTGLITLDQRGRYGVAHSTRNLCWAMRSAEEVNQHMWGERISK